MDASYTVLLRRDVQTRLWVGHVPRFPGAHSQGQTIDELKRNMREVIQMLLEDHPPRNFTLQYRRPVRFR